MSITIKAIFHTCSGLVSKAVDGILMNWIVKIPIWWSCSIQRKPILLDHEKLPKRPLFLLIYLLGGSLISILPAYKVLLTGFKLRSRNSYSLKKGKTHTLFSLLLSYKSSGWYVHVLMKVAKGYFVFILLFGSISVI